MKGLCNIITLNYTSNNDDDDDKEDDKLKTKKDMNESRWNK